MVVKGKESRASTEFQGFPLDHYSYSAWKQFSSNPFMFKVNRINGDTIETTSSPSNAVGRSMHEAMKYYLGAGDEPTPKDDGEAIKFAHKKGTEYLANISDGFIEYNEKIAKNRQQMEERFAFAFFGYLKEFDYKANCKEVLLVEKMLKHHVEVDGRALPIPLKGSADLVYVDKEDRVRIEDHKFTGQYSPEESIDGGKLVQAAFNYFLVYAETGRKPYSMTFREFKIIGNKDGSPQTRLFEIVYEEQQIVFDLFFRLYDDVTAALMGKQVYIPNLDAFYDREVSLIAYIHRLDVDGERAKQFKKLKVENITDFLKKKIQKEGSMKKYLETVSKKFISAKTLNYKAMKIEERIKMKLAEHGLGVEFHSKTTGGSVELYRYEPNVGLKMTKIEGYVKDIEQVVETSGVRVLAPIPDSGLVGFEVPLKHRTFPKQKPKGEGFNIAIGVNIAGETVRMDIRQAPHILISGATGSGKSTGVTSFISQLLDAPTGHIELVLLDPKMVELAQFKKDAAIYADEMPEICQALKGLVIEMNNRYKELQKKRVKNLEEYRDKGGKLPYIIVVLDEYADCAVSEMYGPEIKTALLTLAGKARAAGIHIALTTQRPSTKIISGDIKANFPTRIAFKTSSAVDSQVILDVAGAEKLLGKGDMLFLDPTSSKGLQRLQGFNF